MLPTTVPAVQVILYVTPAEREMLRDPPVTWKLPDAINESLVLLIMKVDGVAAVPACGVEEQ